ncbi:hypothetical protein M2310_002252 [Rhizobium leguminosarum]|uniref:Uncharacterized protein n=1 Tax=Rhizobium esperanzae TaxID=1967781 RepID=A0A7W6UJT9_9HYPH|nr:hypothetical protein [Rhizobium esperanzae]MDH6201576.1 hypothetical protein [Rhizobium leguminosarum]
MGAVMNLEPRLRLVGDEFAEVVAFHKGDKAAE